MSAGDIAANFEHLSRPAVSRHLRVLRECGVVQAERRGKLQDYVLNPEPLVALRDGWLAAFGTMQMKSLSALRRQAESEPGGQASD